MSSSNVTSIARLRGKVDATGDTVTIDAPRRRKRKKGWRDRVGLVDLELLSKLELSGMEYRVLLTMWTFIPEKGGSDAMCTQRELADKAGMHQSSVAVILKRLQERHVVQKVRQGRWHVSSWLMYNGDFDSWNADAEKDPEPIWVRDVSVTTGEVK